MKRRLRNRTNTVIRSFKEAQRPENPNRPASGGLSKFDMIWQNVRGHGRVVEMFRRSLARGRLAHAYLFAGPDGVGKKLFARKLATCLVCDRLEDAQLQACGECSNCRQMAAGSHADFHPVELLEGKRELILEQFVGERGGRRGREGLCYELSLRPMSARRRIAVIDDAHLMNAESANSLLKTLEEPPADSVLILVSSRPSDLLPTIRSRCQTVRFAPLAEADVADLLVERGLVDERSETAALAGLCEGSLALAGQLLDPGLRSLRESLYAHLARGDFHGIQAGRELLDGLDEIGGDGPTQRRNAGWLVRFCVDFYSRALRSLAEERLEAVEPVRRFVQAHSPPTPQALEHVTRLLNRAAEAEIQLDRLAPIPLCLEGLLLDLARLARR